ncbi:uncharacterized protein LOC121427243 isoform X2 [Lytechinus variegatus]|uniref:uncharacterized protein LOC121427243 isoform X2 n=1 Tax=Lytechinus variegatus TaxID=7654 RepID=UPI001BB1A6A8|nr:uncharacterized protein LOC121427243 isoform X2 [Lytechinus variegatus]
MCRVCAGRVHATDKLKECATERYRKEILAVFDVSTFDDQAEIHPKHLCRKCLRKVQHQSSGRRNYGSQHFTTIQWTKHLRKNCRICHHKWRLNPQKKRKYTYHHLHKTKSLEYTIPAGNIFEHLHKGSIVIPSSEQLSTVHEHDCNLFTCAICQCILGCGTSVQTSCEHTCNFCSECLSKYFIYNKCTVSPCPICSKNISIADVTSSPRFLYTTLCELEVYCVCGKTGLLQTFSQHICKLQERPVERQNVTLQKAGVAIEEAIRHSADIPRSVERASSFVVWKKLQEDGHAIIQTPGRPIHVKKACSCESFKEIQHNEEEFDAAKTLAMMNDVHLTWSQYRQMNRYNNGKFSSERKLRALNSQLQKQTYDTIYIDEEETFHIDSKKTVTRTAKHPYVYISNLQETVMDFLESNEKSGFLTNHDGVIPEDQVWIKFGGDHGGGSFKLAVEVCNVQNPNASHNTLIVGYYEGPDSVSSLQIMIRPIARQLKQMKKSKWREKKIHILCFGDYEFLVKTYGIFSCNARYCCIYCLLTRDGMQRSKEERVPSVKRSLKKIKSDFRKFRKSGSNKLISKEVSHSIVRKAMIPIEIDDVVIPTLHLSLGIFKRIYDLFERDCLAIEQKIKHLQELPEVVFLHPKLGPLIQGLENTLQTFHVYRQQYHGGAFVGNHVNTCCKPEVIEALTQSPILTLRRMQNEMDIPHDILRQAATIGEKYKELFYGFADCHSAISTKKKMSEEEIKQTEKAIGIFMRMIRKAGISISPKLHILEDHIVHQLHKFRVGLGLLNEQGIESMHANFNQLRRRMAGISNSNNRIISMLRAHHMTTLPTIKSQQRQPIKRKLFHEE